MKKLFTLFILTLSLSLTAQWAPNPFDRHHNPDHGTPPGHGGDNPGHGGTPPGHGGDEEDYPPAPIDDYVPELVCTALLFIVLYAYFTREKCLT